MIKKNVQNYCACIKYKFGNMCGSCLSLCYVAKYVAHSNTIVIVARKHNVVHAQGKIYVVSSKNCYAQNTALSVLIPTHAL